MKMFAYFVECVTASASQ